MLIVKYNHQTVGPLTAGRGGRRGTARRWCCSALALPQVGGQSELPRLRCSSSPAELVLVPSGTGDAAGSALGRVHSQHRSPCSNISFPGGVSAAVGRRDGLTVPPRTHGAAESQAGSDRCCHKTFPTFLMIFLCFVQREKRRGGKTKAV